MKALSDDAKCVIEAMDTAVVKLKEEGPLPAPHDKKVLTLELMQKFCEELDSYEGAWEMMAVGEFPDWVKGYLTEAAREIVRLKKQKQYFPRELMEILKIRQENIGRSDTIRRNWHLFIYIEALINRGGLTVTDACEYATEVFDPSRGEKRLTAKRVSDIYYAQKKRIKDLDQKIRDKDASK